MNTNEIESVLTKYFLPITSETYDKFMTELEDLQMTLGIDEIYTILYNIFNTKLLRINDTIYYMYNSQLVADENCEQLIKKILPIITNYCNNLSTIEDEYIEVSQKINAYKYITGRDRLGLECKYSNESISELVFQKKSLGTAMYVFGGKFHSKSDDLLKQLFYNISIPKNEIDYCLKNNDDINAYFWMTLKPAFIYTDNKLYFTDDNDN